MELFTLDAGLVPDTVIDTHESLIWTERRSAWGDFELDIDSSRAVKSLLAPGTYLGLNKSKRIQVVETLEDTVDQDGKSSLKVTGRTIEKILDDRAAMPALTKLSTTPTWDLSGLPVVLINKIFTDICVTGVLSNADKIALYQTGSALPTGSIAAPTETATLSLDPDSVYNSIKKIADLYGLGFRMTRSADDKHLNFNVFTGTDRTSAQTLYPAVIFSPALDNLSDTKELASNAAVKNVAYVFAPNGVATVYATGVDPAIADLDRRVLMVKADDITLPAGSALDVALIQRGKEQLSLYRDVYGFDGEISQLSGYIYDNHYNLGDLVELRGTYGLASNMRVTEQIFIQDAEGERAYPTLQQEIVYSADTWLAYGAGRIWSEIPDTNLWANV